MSGRSSNSSTHFRVTSTHIDAALRYRAVFALLADRWRPDIRVLEVGSGSGGAAEWLDHEVVGVDTAFERTCRAQAPEPDRASPGARRRSRCPTRASTPCSASTCSSTSRRRPAAAIAELMRVLAPGGRLLLTLPVGACGRASSTAGSPAAYAARHGQAAPLGRGAPRARPPGCGRDRGARARPERASPSSRTSGRRPGASSTAPTPSGAGCRSRGRSSAAASSTLVYQCSPA